MTGATWSLFLASAVGIPTAIGQVLVALDGYEPKGWPFVVSGDKRVEVAGAAWYAFDALFVLVAVLVSLRSAPIGSYGAGISVR